MTEKISRRSFLKKGTALGVSSVIGSTVRADAAPKKKESASKLVDISVVTGKDYYANTLKAVSLLGGIQRFNIKNSKATAGVP